jgi:predicted nucleotide-binding protein (sugar kinase/HSP70/actin superfamily)
MDLVSAPAMAARCMFGNMTTNARTQGYIIEEGKVKVTWEMDEFFKYLSDEDITDDYEAGINGNVKRAARKLLGDYSGLSEESSPSCEV